MVLWYDKKGGSIMNQKMKKIGLIGFFFLLLICSGCSNKKEEENLLGIDFDSLENVASLPQYKTGNPIVAMWIENYGAIVMELYPKKAENTVNNFISLVKSGFYDHNTFHRLVPGFVLQGGDKEGTGVGGPGYTIKGEFANNGYQKNDLSHDKKIVSMARSQDPDSAGSQFFIMLEKADYLDGDYAAFGKVIDGFDILEKIESSEQVEDSSTGKLQKNLVIKKAIVDQKGVEYQEVIKREGK